MVEQHQVVERVGGRDSHDPVDAARDEGVGLVVGDYFVFFKRLGGFVGVNGVHEESGQQFDDQELQDVLFAAVGEVLGFLPVGQRVGFLAVVEGPKMVHLLLVFNHDSVNLFVFHNVLCCFSVTLSRS